MFSAHNSVLFIASRRGEVERLRLSLGDPELARGHGSRSHCSLQQICSASSLTDDTHILLAAMLLLVVVRVYAGGHFGTRHEVRVEWRPAA